MKKVFVMGLLMILSSLIISSCKNESDAALKTENKAKNQSSISSTGSSSISDEHRTDSSYTVTSKISEVLSDPVFGDYGKLIFPVDDSYYSGNTLGELRLTWYTNIDPNKTVEIVNYIKNHAEAGDVVFYDIYTDEEKIADPKKEDTGLFFSKEIREKDLPYVTPAAASRMSEQCRTASLTLWNYQKRVITLSL